jgi:hypothetical protein
LVAPTITTSGTSFKTGGLKVILDNLVAVAANAAKANPTTTATVAVTTATGGLLAGTYRCSYTFCDAYGETLAGGESATFTVTGTTQLATVTLPALPTGVQSINLYLTPANGGVSGTEYLYATGITGTTYACTPTLPIDVPGATTPAANTTGAAVHYPGSMPRQRQPRDRPARDPRVGVGLPRRRPDGPGQRSSAGTCSLGHRC